jgi:hypothetical protein
VLPIGVLLLLLLPPLGFLLEPNVIEPWREPRHVVAACAGVNRHEIINTGSIFINAVFPLTTVQIIIIKQSIYYITGITFLKIYV